MRTGWSLSRMGFSALSILLMRSIDARPFGMLYPAFENSFKGLMMLYSITR